MREPVNCYTLKLPQFRTKNKVPAGNKTEPHPSVIKKCLRCGKFFLTDLDEPNRDHCVNCLTGDRI